MRVQAFGVNGVGELRAGDDLAGALLVALAAMGERLLPGDVLAVSSKVVSKVEGRSVPVAERSAALTRETVRLVARRRTPHGVAEVVQAAAGPVMAAAGIDASNVPPGHVLLLPVDPDASARALRTALREAGVHHVGVLITDTAGRAWRDGQVDFALGAAGVFVAQDLRGTPDTSGQPLEVTVRAVADEVAALADLVKGKVAGVPAAVVRGLPGLVTDDDGPGAAALVRPAGEDWFRLGHVEAVRAALGVDPGEHPPPALGREPLQTRLARAVQIAIDAPTPWQFESDLSIGATATDVGFSVRCADRAWLGALAQRLSASAWAEDLVLRISLGDDTLSLTAEEDASRISG